MNKHLIHKREQLYFGLLVAVSIPLYILLLISMVGLGFLAFLFITPLFAHFISMAHIRSNGVKVTEKQFPAIHRKVAELSEEMGVSPMPDVYIIESGGILNAFASRFFGRNMVVLLSGIAELTAEEDEKDNLHFIIAHELAHIKRNHILKQLLVLPGNWIPFLGTAYSRACEYTCDRMAVRYTNNSEAAMRGLTLLAIGPKLYKEVDLHEYMTESSKETGWFVWLAEALSTHPTLPKRIHALHAQASMETTVIFRIPTYVKLLASLYFGGSLLLLVAAIIGTVTFLNSDEWKQYLTDPVFAEDEYGIEYEDVTDLMNYAADADLEGIHQQLNDGADVNAADSGGWTALHYAVFSEYEEAAVKEVAQVLLQHGADPTIKDIDGLTPADWAEENGFIEVAELLRNAIKNDNTEPM